MEGSVLYDGNAFPLQSARRKRDTAAGIGCDTKISFREGGKRVSV